MSDDPRRSALRATLASFRFAGRGVVLLLRTQRNARIHAGVTLAITALGSWLGLSAREWCWIVLAMMAVWTTEALNTALEALADAAVPDAHPLVERAKDVAAGAVLIASVGSVLIGVLVLGPHLLRLVP